MAGDIKVRIVGDASAFEKSLGNAKKLSSGFSKELESEAKKAGAGFDKMGEGADGAETRLLGLKDSVDGVATVMQGPGEQGIAAYIQGWADMASGVANFAVPAFKRLVAGGADQVKSIARATAATAAAVAKQVAQWVVMGAQATAQAARVAAAWLISIGPVLLVGAAIAGLVVLVIKHWDTITSVFSKALDFIKGVVSGAIDWIKANWPLLLAILTGPIGLAVLAISRHWDTIKGGVTAVKDFIVGAFEAVVGFFTGLPGRLAKIGGGMFDFIKDAFRSAINWVIRGWNRLEFSIPGFDPPGPIGKIGGFTLGVPDIPEFNNGGIVPGPRGVPRLALVHGGETVLPTHRYPSSRSTEVNVNVEGVADFGAIAELVATKIAWHVGGR